MASIRIAIDNIQNKSADTKTLEAVAELLRKQGHTVTTHGVGPNRIQQVMQKSSNKCDIMIQIAGGKCLGTLVDFYKGVGKYYHATRGAFLYYKCWDANWKAKRAWDDNFSSNASLAPYKGKTLPEIYKTMSDKMSYGYGNSAEELVQTYTGGNTSEESNSGDSGGTSILELIKQVCSDLDKYGVELLLRGDTVHIGRTNPNKATVLDPRTILNGQITFNDYDNTTPNENHGVKDSFLIDRYGVIPCDEVDSTWYEQVLLMAQRGHGHSIDLKCLYRHEYLSGHWVKLSLPDMGIVNRPYYVTKHSYDEENVLSITLEPGPPSLYVEQEPVEEDTGTEDNTEET